MTRIVAQALRRHQTANYNRSSCPFRCVVDRALKRVARRPKCAARVREQPERTKDVREDCKRTNNKAVRPRSSFTTCQAKPAGSTSRAQRTRRLDFPASAARHNGRNCCNAARRELCTTICPRSKPARRASNAGTGGKVSTCAACFAVRATPAACASRRKSSTSARWWASAASTATCVNGGNWATLPLCQQALCQAFVIVRVDRGIHRMIGKISLDDDFARAGRPVPRARQPASVKLQVARWHENPRCTTHCRLRARRPM